VRGPHSCGSAAASLPSNRSISSGILLIDINLFFQSNDTFRAEESEAALEGLHIE
jgi:hypothetical protein